MLRLCDKFFLIVYQILYIIFLKIPDMKRPNKLLNKCLVSYDIYLVWEWPTLRKKAYSPRTSWELIFPARIKFLFCKNHLGISPQEFYFENHFWSTLNHCIALERLILNTASNRSKTCVREHKL